MCGLVLIELKFFIYKVVVLVSTRLFVDLLIKHLNGVFVNIFSYLYGCEYFFLNRLTITKYSILNNSFQ